MKHNEEDKHQKQQRLRKSVRGRKRRTLPTEIIIIILLKLPVESLLRCKSVCKVWFSLISDPHFVNSHLTHSTTKLILNIWWKPALQTFDLNDVMHDASLNVLNDDFPCEYPREWVRIVGSCNGLLCISVDGTPFLWNPSTSKSSRLPSFGYERSDFSVHFGFGYEESTNDYKVVSVGEHTYEYDAFVKMYSLRNGSWKDIGAFPHGKIYGFCKFLNGALHWAVKGDDDDWKIVFLDLATETYGEVLQPAYDERYDEEGWDLTLGSLKEWLCVLCDSWEVCVDLWVMKVYGVKDSWTKLVSVTYMPNPARDQYLEPVCISNDGKILMAFGPKLIIYDSENSLFSEIQNFDKCVQPSTFVESLVSPMSAIALGHR